MFQVRKLGPCTSDQVLTIEQRLKGAIDSRIAEEQARQRLSQASPSRSGSNPRSSSRNISPSKRAARQAARGRQDGEPPAKGPDPAEFEPDFVIDDDVQSRSGTPRPPTERNGVNAADKSVQEPSAKGESSQESAETTSSVEEPRASLDLPTDVRVKLRKLEKLESRYHGALYRPTSPITRLTYRRVAQVLSHRTCQSTHDRAFRDFITGEYPPNYD